MQMTFLGTAASEGYPNVFCACANCEQARALGGPNLRKRSSLLINDDLLIDLGPDLMAAALMHNFSLARLRYCLQTHEHSDHLDASHFFSRSPGCGVAAPRLHYYASAPALARAATLLGRQNLDGGLRNVELGERLNLSAHLVESFQHFEVGPYRVTSVAATHAPETTALLYVIEQGTSTLFYATDTGELGEQTWQALIAGGFRFDVVALDHTFGLRERSSGHMNQAQFLEQVARMRHEGLLAEGARVFAHHIAHHSNPSHPELALLAGAHGYEVAYDGLVVTLGSNTASVA